MKLVVPEMRKLFRCVLFLVLLLPLFAAFQPAQAETGTVVRVDPTMLTVNAQQDFSIDIKVEDVENLYGFDVSVQYDPDYLDLNNVELGDFLESGILMIDDNDPGIINFINSQLNDPLDPVLPKSGSGILFTIHFSSRLLDGQTPLTILEPDNMPLLSASPDEEVMEIPCSVEHGTVTIVNVQPEMFITFLPLVMH